MPVRGIDHGGCKLPSALAREKFFLFFFFFFCGNVVLVAITLWMAYGVVLSHLGNWGQSWRHGENKKDRYTGWGCTKSERNMSQNR